MNRKKIFIISNIYCKIRKLYANIKAKHIVSFDLNFIWINVILISFLMNHARTSMLLNSKYI